MLSNQVLQKTINDISKIIEVDCSIWSVDSICLATTGTIRPGIEKGVRELLRDLGNREEKLNKRTLYFLIQDDFEPVYVLAIHEEVENGKMLGRLCVKQLEALIQVYKTRVDKNQFYQNLLLDNMLLVDVFKQARKMNIELEKKRVIFLIEPKQEGDSIILETVKGVYVTGPDDFVTSVDEGHIILVKALDETEDYKDLHEVGRAIVDTLSAEAMVSARVSYGTVVNEIKDLSKSYKEAVMALDVGRVFYADKNVLAYSKLGIGRLIHQLPYNLCDMYLKEVFEGKGLEQFDDETLVTINSFFENSLNISETARKLYVHRNTLVYRLEKIQRLTGLDIRVFEDALSFKIAMMVSNHMKLGRD